MALDAFVFCDCFEKDNLRSNPPRGIKLKIAPNGDLTCNAPSMDEWFAFADWKQTKACAHTGMILKHHRLGNAAILDPLRTQLEEQRPAQFPILLHKILYSATHTCDWLPLPVLPKLTDELKRLEHHGTPAAEPLRHLKIQLAELIIAAQMAHKPICF